MKRTLSDRRALDAIATLLNQKRHPNDIAAALLLLLELTGCVRETGRRVTRYRKRPFRIVPPAEHGLRTAVRRCLTHGYDLGPISRIVLETVQIPLRTVPATAKAPPRGSK
jgi:hypothetical protein